MMSSVQLCPPALSRWNQQPSPRLTIECTLTKQGQRFLTKLATSGDPAAAKNLIRRFVETSPKSVVLTTLSHLLSPDNTQPYLASLVLPLYARISEASWFSWNPKIVADLDALLDKQGRYEESETLIFEAISKIGSRNRELALFYCKLIESHSKRRSERGFNIAYSYLNQLLHSSSSVYIKRRVYESMVSGLCTIDRAREAEHLVDDMRNKGVKPSAFELRSIMYGYGRLGLFKDMLRIVDRMEKEEFVIDTVCSNMVLSTYGLHGEHKEMVSWLQRMRNSGIPFSIRTYNSVLNSCPTIMRKLLDFNGLPLSIEELNASLKGDEAMVVRELLDSSQILEELLMHRRLNESNYGIPAEVVVVCGAGKHSNVRGESPVKILVKEMMVNMRSPLRIDRKNTGCFIAKALEYGITSNLGLKQTSTCNT